MNEMNEIEVDGRAVNVLIKERSQTLSYVCRGECRGERERRAREFLKERSSQ